MATVLIDRAGPCVRITLNRPEVRNALNLEMVRELGAALGQLEPDDSIGAVILTGAGEKAFVAGADIAELEARDAVGSLAAINARLFRQIESFPAPVIAAIRGFALGGGCEMTLACDLRVAGASSRFGQPEVGLGIIPAAGGTQRLPRLIGLSRAKELVLTGRIIDAEEALRIGLVHRVVPDEQVLDEAQSLANTILEKGTLAVRLAKLALNAAFPGFEIGQTLESVAQAVLFETPEKHRRMQEFLNRKKP
ncbi:MAG: enoyl-CoA hydratase/isomerase family protein [Candidatus Eisenbacteria bacterium]|uniref:Enoyl-CoA hydratase/isomerase family protein n=1 Tax=Eiseniibacteriota bacterium TaxID=2212470 RepID=A0A956M258_UNCEI|nr:enoyl-CoA hydratase/isomerase family protein [Candidatus Eisenbacteria bacterium]